MSETQKKKIEAAVKRDLPGYRVKAIGAVPVNPMQVDKDETLDIEKLAKKYLSGNYHKADSSDNATESAKTAQPPEEEQMDESVTQQSGSSKIVVVELEDSRPLDRGSRPKTVIYSEKEDKIKGFQG